MALGDINFASPQYLPYVLAAGVVIVAAALALGRRHGGRSRALAATLRLCALGVLGVVLLAPIVNVKSESLFEPSGTWRLLLQGADADSAQATDFAETPDEFVSRVRDALTGQHPPARCEIYGADARQVLAARDAVLALGVPCEARYPGISADSPEPVITGIDAPLTVRPGEPFRVNVQRAGPAAQLEVTLNGEPVEGDELRLSTPGRYVLEAVLRDASGREIQRAGHVLRVGDAPAGISVGLDAKGLARLRELAPDAIVRALEPAAVDAAALVDLHFVVATIDALNRMPRQNAEGLAAYVADGGGLFITGDGAKYVAPEYLPDPVRALLPVALKNEGKQPPPEDPPVVLDEGLAEITKVSICYVLDASRSMEVSVRPDLTRWQVATKGVTESIKLIRKGGREDGAEGSASVFDTRVAVMSFTLKQKWIYGPLEITRQNAAQIEQQLRERGDDGEFAELGFNTDIYAATQEALRVMETEKAAVRVIVLLTDGADRPQHDLEGRRHSELRDRAVKAGITIYTIGIGDDFVGDGGLALSARRVINDLANPSDYAYIPSPQDVDKAHVLFVRATETAFRTFDKKKEDLEIERKRRLEEMKAKGEEPPMIDVLPGVFPVSMSLFGSQLFGSAMPDPEPKLAWLARNDARDGAAVALFATTDDGAVPALAFRGYGLGRVAFWGAGTELEALGELTGWADFPGVFAASLRWLMPASEPDLRLVAGATPDGIRLLDPLPDARYTLRTQSGEIELKLDGSKLSSDAALPGGAAEVLENGVSIGDVFVAEAAAGQGRAFAADYSMQPVLKSRPPEVTTFKREALTPILYLVTAFLLLMPIERLTRRRS